MALSKPEKLSRVDWGSKIPTTITKQRIMEVCRVEYTKAVSIEIIQHLLGGPNMEYNSIMELEDSFDCFVHCKEALLNHVKETKKDIMAFEERKDSTSEILVIILKQRGPKANVNTLS